MESAAEVKARLKVLDQETKRVLNDPFYRKHPALRKQMLSHLNQRRQELRRNPKRNGDLHDALAEKVELKKARFFELLAEAESKLARAVDRKDLSAINKTQGDIEEIKTILKRYGAKVNGMFDAEATRAAKRVTRIPRESPKARRTIVEKETGERGYLLGTLPGGWLKVQWDNRQRPTLVKRSELKRANPKKKAHRVVYFFHEGSYYPVAADVAKRAGYKVVYLKDEHGYSPVGIENVQKKNPGLVELVGGLQAADYLLGKVSGRKNPSQGGAGAGASSSDVRSPTRTSTEVRSPTKTSTVADTRGNITVTGGAGAGATTSVTIRRNAELEPGFYVYSPANGGGRWWLTPRNQMAQTMAEARRFNSKADAKEIARQQNALGWGKGMNWRVFEYKRKRNPTAREMSERFQGESNGSVKQYYASNAAPRLDFSRVGRLTWLRVNGKNIPVANAVVAIDPVREKLWIAGKIKRALFNKKAPKGQRLNYGDVDGIGYITAKAHIGEGETFDYRHNFGEEGGRKPQLLIDDEGMPILHGGDYKIEDRGIVD